MKVHKVKLVGDPTFSEIDEYGYPRYTLIMESQEIRYIMNSIGKSAKGADFLIVKLYEGGGDYEEIWAGKGFPYVWNKVRRIK